ncbi:hypothetical protein [Parasitella parasitica]|uniref:XPG N-terminal domain-containing protein n=1 Tax=Parasitella parasitica TaxID=35722 RepID=A0A0B7N291_9FUNG|nr:hypothetical protein [Parasitella parasitica]
MGIHGLSYFIKSLPAIVDNVNWKIEQNKPSKIHQDHFIIDGNAFVYHIAFENRTNWTHGGQYADIADIIVKTVDVLQRAGIRLTFLFDGALPPDKLETRVKRHKSYIERCVSTYWNLKQINTGNNNADERKNGIQYYGDLFLIPPLTLEVIIQTIKELDVDVKVCKAEADGEVVIMAIKDMAYVVSQDSDMHVYPHVGKGYIPLELLQVPNYQNQNSQDKEYVSAGVYHPETLAKSLRLEPFQLPLFGTLLGNDYLDADLVRFPISHWCNREGIHITKNNQSGWPKVVAEFLRRNSHLEERGKGKDCIIHNIATQLMPIIASSSMKSREEKANSFEDRIIDSINRYDASSPLLKKSSAEFQHNNENTSETHIDNISKQFLYTKSPSRQIMDVITTRAFWTSIFLEDIERESSWDVSRSLRQCLYGTVSERLGDHQEIIVQEYIREKQHLEVVQVKGGVIQNQRSTPLIDFYRIHVSNLNHVKDHDPVLHPLILSMRYMLYHCSQSIENGRLFNYEVIAIIISTLRSMASTLGYSVEEVSVPDIGIPALKKRSIHVAAQYQGIVYSSFLLSQILDLENFLQMPQVLSRMYNGLYFHYYIEIARGGASISKMLHNTAPKFKTLFCSIYKSIMTGLHDEVQDVFDYDIITSATEEWVISENKPKRLMSISKKQPDKKKKKRSQETISNSNRSTNAFNVLSFGCNFDE